MEVQPIRNDDDHHAALVEINRLWGSPPDTDDGERLDVLLVLLESYEQKRWHIDEPDWDPADILRYAIEELGHGQSELAELLGSRSRASEVLSRQRPLTLEMIRAINAQWKIPASLLIRPYRVRVA